MDIRKSAKIWIVALLFVIQAMLVFGQDGGGGKPGAFMRLGVGARALAMGRAFTAIADDASATYWNPAGLSQIQYLEIMGNYASLSMDRSYNFGSVAIPVRQFGVLGVSWMSLGVDNIEGRDEMGRMRGLFANSENAYLFSLGKSISDYIHFGVTAKYITHSLDVYKATGYGFDAGLFLKISDGFQVGATVRDLGTKIKWNTQANSEEVYPITARVGIGYTPAFLPVTIAADLSKIEGRDMDFHAGLDLNIVSGSGLRVGYDRGRLSMGAYFSFVTGQFKMNTHYSFGEDPIDHSNVHRVSFAIQISPEFQYQIKDLNPEKLDGNLSMLYPPPDARIVKVLEDHPNYALINAGSIQGLKPGHTLGIYRLKRNSSKESGKKIKIGILEVVQVRENVSAAMIRSMMEGYGLKEGDILIRE